MAESVRKNYATVVASIAKSGVSLNVEKINMKRGLLQEYAMFVRKEKTTFQLFPPKKAVQEEEKEIRK